MLFLHFIYLQVTYAPDTNNETKRESYDETNKRDGEASVDNASKRFKSGSRKKEQESQYSQKGASQNSLNNGYLIYDPNENISFEEPKMVTGEDDGLISIPDQINQTGESNTISFFSNNTSSQFEGFNKETVGNGNRDFLQIDTASESTSVEPMFCLFEDPKCTSSDVCRSLSPENHLNGFDQPFTFEEEFLANITREDSLSTLNDAGILHENEDFIKYDIEVIDLADTKESKKAHVETKKHPQSTTTFLDKSLWIHDESNPVIAIKNSILSCSENLFNALHEIFKTQSLTSGYYLNKFIQTKEHFESFFEGNREVRNCLDDVCKQFDDEIKGLLLSNDNNCEDIGAYFAILVQNELNEFLSTPKDELSSSLNFSEKIKKKIFCEEIMGLQRYYQKFPELMILDSLRDIGVISYQGLRYLKVLNIFISICIEKEESLLKYRELIYKAIEKIMCFMLPTKNLTLDKSKIIRITRKNCCKEQTEYLYIFIFFLHKCWSKTICDPNILNVEIRYHNKFKNYIKVLSLFLIHRHLLLDIYFDVENFNEEVIKRFITFIKSDYNCYNCVIDKCMDIILNGKILSENVG